MESVSPKVLFYLQNYDQIIEWARLGKSAASELDGWLRSWQERMAEDPPEVGTGVEFRGQTGSTPGLFWHRSSWRAGDGGGRINVGIGFEWQARHPHRKDAFYRGIWVHRRIGPDKNERLKARLDQLVQGADLAAKPRNNKWWSFRAFSEPLVSVFEDLPGGADSYEPQEVQRALQAFQDEEIQAAKEIWDRCADLVDQALQEVSGSGFMSRPGHQRHLESEPKRRRS